jgi:hypothetical protein
VSLCGTERLAPSLQHRAVVGVAGTTHSINRLPLAVIQQLQHDNLTASTATAVSTYSLKGSTIQTDGRVALGGIGYTSASVVQAFSVSKPVDYEFLSAMQYTLSSETVVRIVHDPATSKPNEHFVPTEPLVPTVYNWTTFVLPTVTFHLTIDVVDTPDYPVVSLASDTWSRIGIVNMFLSGGITSVDDLFELDSLAEVGSSSTLTFPSYYYGPYSSVAAAPENHVTKISVKLVSVVETSTTQVFGLPIVIQDDDHHPTPAAALRELVWTLRPVQDANVYDRPSAKAHWTYLEVGPGLNSPEQDAASIAQFCLQGSAVNRPSKGNSPIATLNIAACTPLGVVANPRGFVLGEIVVRDGQWNNSLWGSTQEEQPPPSAWLPGNEVRLLVNISFVRLDTSKLLVRPKVLGSEFNDETRLSSASISIFSPPGLDWVIANEDGLPIDPSLAQQGTRVGQLASWVTAGRVAGTGTQSVQLFFNASGLPDGRPAVRQTIQVVPRPGSSSTVQGASLEVLANVKAGRAVVSPPALDVLVSPGTRATTTLSVTNVGSGALDFSVRVVDPLIKTWLGLLDQNAVTGNSSDPLRLLGKPTLSGTLVPSETGLVTVEVVPPSSQPGGFSAQLVVSTSDSSVPSQTIPVSVQVTWSVICPRNFSLASTPTFSDLGRVDVSNLSPFTLSLAIDSSTFRTIDSTTGDMISSTTSSVLRLLSTQVPSSSSDPFPPVVIGVTSDTLPIGSSPRGVTITLSHPRGRMIRGALSSDFIAEFDIVTWRRTSQENQLSVSPTSALGTGGAAAVLMRAAVAAAGNQGPAGVDDFLLGAGATLIQHSRIRVVCAVNPGETLPALSAVSGYPIDSGAYGPGGARARIVAERAFLLPFVGNTGGQMVFIPKPTVAVQTLVDTWASQGFASLVPDWITTTTLGGAERIAKLDAALASITQSQLTTFEASTTSANSQDGASTEATVAVAAEISQQIPASEALRLATLMSEEMELSDRYREIRSYDLTDRASGALTELKRIYLDSKGLNELQERYSKPAPLPQHIHNRLSRHRPTMGSKTRHLQQQPTCTPIAGLECPVDEDAQTVIISLADVLALERPSITAVNTAKRVVLRVLADAATDLRRLPLPLPETLASNRPLRALVVTADSFGQLTVPIPTATSKGLEIFAITTDSAKNATSAFQQAGLVSANRDQFVPAVTAVTAQATRTGSATLRATVAGTSLRFSGHVYLVTGPSCSPPSAVPDVLTGLTCVCASGFYLERSTGECTLCPEGTQKQVSGNTTTCDPCPASQFSLGGKTTCRGCPIGLVCSEGRASVVQGLWHEDPLRELMRVQALVNANLAPASSLPTNTSLLAPTARHKWWLQLDDLVFHACPVAGICLVNTSLDDSSGQVCVTGHEGALCAVCQTGYASTTGSAGDRCFECWDPSTSWAVTSLSALVVIAMMVVVAAPAAKKLKAQPGSNKSGHAEEEDTSDEEESVDSRSSKPTAADSGAAAPLPRTMLLMSRASRSNNKARRAGLTTLGPLKPSETLFEAAMKSKQKHLKQRTGEAKERATPIVRSMVNYLQAVSVIASLRMAGSEGSRSVLATGEVGGGISLGLFPVQCAANPSFLDRLVASLSLPIIAIVSPFAVAAVLTSLLSIIRAVRACFRCKRRAEPPSTTSTEAPPKLADTPTALAPPAHRIARIRSTGHEDPSLPPPGSSPTPTPLTGRARAASPKPTAARSDSPTKSPPQREDSMVRANFSPLNRPTGPQGPKIATESLPPRMEAGCWAKYIEALKMNMRLASYSVVALLFVLHFGVVRAVFHAFELYAQPVYGSFLLRADFETTTSSQQYQSLILPLAIAGGAVYGLGIPLIGVFVLLHNRHRLKDPEFQARFGFLYRGLSLTRRGRFLFEAVILVRKTGLALIAAFAATDAVGQGYLTTLWLLLFLVLHLLLKPYEDSLVNSLESMSLTVLTTTQVANMYYASSGYDWLPWLVIIANACTFAAYVFSLLILSRKGFRYAAAVLNRYRRKCARRYLPKACCPDQDDDGPEGSGLCSSLCGCFRGDETAGASTDETDGGDSATMSPPEAATTRTLSSPPPPLNSMRLSIEASSKSKQDGLVVFSNPLEGRDSVQARLEAIARSKVSANTRVTANPVDMSSKSRVRRPRG